MTESPLLNNFSPSLCLVPTLLVPPLTKFLPIAESDTLAILKSLKFGSPADPCPARVLAGVAEVVNSEVNMIINLSLQTAIVPPTWKQAKLLPLLKKT